MERRTFLKALGLALAGTALPDLSWAVGPEPTWVWTDWTQLRLRSGAAGVAAWISRDGEPWLDVTRYPELMKKVGTFVHVEPGEGCVRFSGGAGAAQGSGMRVVVPDLDQKEDVLVECSVKLNPPMTSIGDTAVLYDNGTVRSMSVDGKTDLAFRDFREATIGDVKIESIRPRMRGSALPGRYNAPEGAEGEKEWQS